MPTASHWRETSKAVIAKALAALGTSPTAVAAKAALRKAYPFGERKYWPYKIWLEEVSIAMGDRFGPPKQQIDRHCAACGARPGAFCKPIGDQVIDLSMMHEVR